MKDEKTLSDLLKSWGNSIPNSDLIDMAFSPHREYLGSMMKAREIKSTSVEKSPDINSDTSFSPYRDTTLNEEEEKKKNVKIVRVGPEERKKMLKRKGADQLTMASVKGLIEEYGIDKTYSLLLYYWYQYKKSGRHSSYYGKFDRFMKAIEKNYKAEPKSVPNLGAMLKKCN